MGRGTPAGVLAGLMTGIATTVVNQVSFSELFPVPIWPVTALGTVAVSAFTAPASASRPLSTTSD